MTPDLQPSQEPRQAVAVPMLADAAAALEATQAWKRLGHSARTLVRRADARQVLIALRAGATLLEHKTDHSVVVQVLRGRVQLHLETGVVELSEQQELLLDAGVRHDLSALERSWVLVTIHWPS